MGDRPIHFSAYWNPTVEFDPLAPKGMKLWARVLRKFEGGKPDERYALYGKVSATGRLGIDPNDIPKLNEIVRKQNTTGETHLYLFNTAHMKEKHPYIPASLHVGLVEEVLDEDCAKSLKEHIPAEFYDSMRRKDYRVPCWFKIKDLREIDLDEFKKLEAYYRHEGRWRDFDRENDLSPLKVRRKDRKRWFTEEESPNASSKGWYEVVLSASRSKRSEPLEPGLFRSAEVRRIYTRALQYAGWNIPLLILGERGTGKTVLASFIRRHYLRTVKKREPEKISRHWCQLPCGSFTDPQLLKSELLGHSKGSFTDAKQDHVGLLKKADGDCLFLDEIHDLSKELQRLLIKALEEGEFRPLGAEEPEESDFRLITASNRSVEELEDKLDPDFLDRINHVRLKMPPLRKLGDDMDMLWSHEYQRVRERFGGGRKPYTELTSVQERELVEILKRHDLPGNFRDLARVAEEVIRTLDDPVSDFSAEQVVRKALGWRTASLPITSAGGSARDIAATFAQDRGLGSVFDNHAIIDVKAFDQEIKFYLGNKIIDLKTERGLSWRDVVSGVHPDTVKAWARRGPR